jgi:hypothetical protein
MPGGHFLAVRSGSGCGDVVEVEFEAVGEGGEVVPAE